MMKCLEHQGHMYALDVDPIEMVKTKKRLEDKGYGEDILTIIQQNFANIDLVAKEHGPFNFMLADLGVSSMQIDNPDRGFSYKVDGPLDLRYSTIFSAIAGPIPFNVCNSVLDALLIFIITELYCFSSLVISSFLLGI